jgi:hypothetical protein
MAKKTRAVTTKSAPTFAGIQRGQVGVDFDPDYSVVKKELKQIVVLAGGMFAFLIILSFFIN